MQSPDQLLLKVGGPSFVPPAGHKLLIVDTDGNVKTIDSSGNKANIGSGSTWFDTEAAAHAALSTSLGLGLTESIPIQCGIANVGEPFPSHIADAAKEGGAIKGNSNTTWGRLVQPNVYQAFNTSKFAVSFKGHLATIAVSQASYFGLINAGASAVLYIGTDQAKDAAQFVAYGFNGSSTTSTVLLGAADTNVHTWRIVSDGTTVRYYLDGTQVGTLATAAANFPTGGGGPALFATTGSAGQALYKVLYSFVGV